MRRCRYLLYRYPGVVDGLACWFLRSFNEIMYQYWFLVRRGVTNRVKVDTDRSNIGSTNRNHPKKPIFPSPKQRHPFVEHEQIFQAFRHVR